MSSPVINANHPILYLLCFRMTDNLDNLTKLKVEATRLLDECEEQEKQTKRYAEEKAKLMDDWAKVGLPVAFRLNGAFMF